MEGKVESVGEQMPKKKKQLTILLKSSLVCLKIISQEI